MREIAEKTAGKKTQNFTWLCRKASGRLHRYKEELAKMKLLFLSLNYQ